VHLVYLVYFYIFYPKSSKFTALELTTTCRRFKSVGSYFGPLCVIQKTPHIFKLKSFYRYRPNLNAFVLDIAIGGYTFISLWWLVALVERLSGTDFIYQLGRDF
jgi:hypothetical protein